MFFSLFPASLQQLLSKLEEENLVVSKRLTRHTPSLFSSVFDAIPTVLDSTSNNENSDVEKCYYASNVCDYGAVVVT